MGGLENDNPPRDDDEESSDDETQDSMHTIVARVESVCIYGHIIAVFKTLF